MTQRDLILFIHGLGGTPRSTWDNFPTLVTEDPDLCDRFVVDFFEYPTSIFPALLGKKPQIPQLADALETEIFLRHSHHEGIFLICHSLGGLVARRWMQKKFYAEKKASSGPLLRGALFYASPNSGSQLASLGSFVRFRNQQLKQLCRESDFLTMLNEAWLHEALQYHFRCKYVVGLLDDVVPPQSACPDWATDYETVKDCDHRSIVKPEGRDATSFLILKNFLLQDLSANDVRETIRKADKLRMSEQFSKSHQTYSAALTEAHARKDPKNEAFAYRGLGHLEVARGRYTEAHRYYRQALKIYELLDEDTLDIGHVYRGLADLYNKQGQYEDARKTLNKARAMYAKHENSVGACHILVGLGHLESNLGNYQAATNAYSEALGIDGSNSKGVKRSHAHAHRGLGDLACDLCHKAAAQEHYDKAMHIYDALSDQRGRANVLEGYGRLSLRFGDLVTAGRYLADALKAYQATNDRLGPSLVHLRLSELRLTYRQLSEARRELRAAEIDYEELQDLKGQAYVLLQLGKIELADGRLTEARRNLQHAHTKFDVLADRVGEARTNFQIGNVELEDGNRDAARELYNRALMTFNEVGDEASSAEVILCMAKLANFEDSADAVEYCDEALTTFKKLGLVSDVSQAMVLRDKLVGRSYGA